MQSVCRDTGQAGYAWATVLYLYTLYQMTLKYLDGETPNYKELPRNGTICTLHQKVQSVGEENVLLQNLAVSD